MEQITPNLDKKSGTSSVFQGILDHPPEETVCCGPPAAPRSSPLERPGYRLCHFVEAFVDTPAGFVPRVKTVLEARDHRVTMIARIGIMRNRHRVAPGLYAAGHPDPDAPVLVTANYTLSFNALRRELIGIDVWILVLDSRGVNVWCAAGKGTFGTREVVGQVQQTNLERVVRHRKLILPQLSATGVSAEAVRKACGFKILWGPVRARDLKGFLAAGMKADDGMRRVTFSLGERLVLVPVEVTLLAKPTLWVLPAVFLLSGIDSNLFSLSASGSRGLTALAAYGAAVLTGAVAAPALLPWLPGKAFSVKGAVTGLAGGAAIVWLFRNVLNVPGAAALMLFALAVSSYVAMNFTGATPFTSPSGVEKEMRRAIPLQAAAVLAAAIAWVLSAFYG